MTRFLLQVRTCGGRLLFAGLSVSVLNFGHGELRAQTLQDQATCANQARKTFQEDSAEWDRQNKQLNIGFQTQTLGYESHYNTKINRCLMLVTRIFDDRGGDNKMSKQLYDAIERRIYAGYSWSAHANKPLSCELIPSHEETKFCKSEDEFNATAQRSGTRANDHLCGLKPDASSGLPRGASSLVKAPTSSPSLPGKAPPSSLDSTCPAYEPDSRNYKLSLLLYLTANWQEEYEVICNCGTA
jgi:hypothetical protein